MVLILLSKKALAPRCRRDRAKAAFSRHGFRIQRILSQEKVDPDQNTQTGQVEIREVGIVPLPHRRFRKGNSTKE